MLSSVEGKAINNKQNLGYLEDEFIDEKNIDVHYFAFPNKQMRE